MTESTDQTAPTRPSINLDVPERVMVIAAHPDDAEFCAGATLAKWGARGAAITHVVLTDGSKGTWDANADQIQLVEQRQDEQRAAAAILTESSAVEFLGFVDGDLAYLDVREAFALRRDLARLIRRYAPQVVLAHDPWKRYRLHPDHEQAGRIAVQGIIAARDPFFHPELIREGFEPHRPDALLLFEADEITHAESVTLGEAHKKVDALLRHASQLETTHFHRVQQDRMQQVGAVETGNSVSVEPDLATGSLDDTIDAFRQRELRLLRETGARVGVDYAEGFAIITDQL